MPFLGSLASGGFGQVRGGGSGGGGGGEAVSSGQGEQGFSAFINNK